REVGVVRGEDVLGRHDVIDLDKQTRVADARVQRVERIGRALRFGPDIGIRERRRAEIDERARERRSAVAAGRSRRRQRWLPLLARPPLQRGAGHTFHGALPLAQRASSSFFSRSVSIGCQNPLCSNAISSPSRASAISGARSHIVASFSRYLVTFGERTKKPPLIRPPSPAGFSEKSWTFSPASS